MFIYKKVHISCNLHKERCDIDIDRSLAALLGLPIYFDFRQNQFFQIVNSFGQKSFYKCVVIACSYKWLKLCMFVNHQCQTRHKISSVQKLFTNDI